MKRGFTLVELSIVLVIIGLLIGGILVAQSMIDTAKIQRIIRDLNQYEISVNNFKTNYKFYPGDAPYFAPNGNGNNQVESFFPSWACSTSHPSLSRLEFQQVWAHLSQARMVDKEYKPFSPVPGSNGCAGGTHNQAYESPQNEALWPAIDIDGKTAAYIQSKRYPILAGKGPDGPFQFYIYVNPRFTIPLETKAGGSIQGGIYNQRGKGICGDINGDDIACTNNNSVMSDLVYILMPI